MEMLKEKKTRQKELVIKKVLIHPSIAPLGLPSLFENYFLKDGKDLILSGFAPHVSFQHRQRPFTASAHE
jgi:hypothetical protein